MIRWDFGIQETSKKWSVEEHDIHPTKDLYKLVQGTRMLEWVSWKMHEPVILSGDLDEMVKSDGSQKEKQQCYPSFVNR